MLLWVTLHLSLIMGICCNQGSIYQLTPHSRVSNNLHSISHPLQCVVVTKWGTPWMSQVLDWSTALRIFTTPFSSTWILLISIAKSIFKQQLAAFLLFYSTPRCTVVVVHENPWLLLYNHLMLNLFSFVTYAVTAYIQTVRGCSISHFHCSRFYSTSRSELCPALLFELELCSTSFPNSTLPSCQRSTPHLIPEYRVSQRIQGWSKIHVVQGQCVPSDGPDHTLA